jgi:hypothetical protein
MGRGTRYVYHIRDLATGKTAKFGEDEYDKLKRWAECRGGRRVFRTSGSWMSIGEPGISVRLWQGYQSLGGGPVNRFIIHRRKIGHG